jgi:hypothetical protein
MQGLILLESALPKECRFSPLDIPRSPAFRHFLARVGGVLAYFRAVAVHDFHAVSSVAKVFADFLGDHDGTVLAAGASERDGQIALAFMM